VAPSHASTTREGVAKRWTGARAGRAIEPRNERDGVLTLSKGRKATSPAALSRGAGGPRAVAEPGHVRNLHAREPGEPVSARPPDQRAGRLRERPWREAWDEPTQAVGSPRRSCEPAEQGHGHGGGGGKGASQGEHGQQTTPRTQWRVWRVKCAGSCAAGGRRRPGGAVHGVAAPHHRGAAPGGVPGDQPEGGAGGGPGEVGILRAGLGGQSPGPGPAGAGGALPGVAESAGLHPKADGRLRPLGIATLEDKIVQRASPVVVNAIDEVDFRGFCYGFRPGRSPHDALDALAVGISGKRVSWVGDADIRDFFGRLDRVWLRRFLQHRIADERVGRLIGRWLAAGSSTTASGRRRWRGRRRGIGVAAARRRVPARCPGPVGRLVAAPPRAR
jgi:hypothetical protein